MPYMINAWQYIDLFIYFSHARFTIPPPMWTDTAHRHGVPVQITHGTRCCDTFLGANVM